MPTGLRPSMPGPTARCSRPTTMPTSWRKRSRSCARSILALLESGRYFVIGDPTGTTVAAGGWPWERPAGQDGTPGHAHLRHFAVDPKRTRLGLGRRLFECCLEDAAGAGAFECVSTYAAESFYRALGFSML